MSEKLAELKKSGGGNTSGIFYIQAPSRYDREETLLTLDAGDYVAIYCIDANYSNMNIVSPNNKITITDDQPRVQIYQNMYYKITYFTAQQGATVAGNCNAWLTELVVIPQ